MSEVDQREEVVFEAVLKLRADQHAAYLDKECAGDAGLRRRVEVLLSAFERAGGFLKEPAIPTPARTVRCSLPVTEKTGDKIGHYKLLQQIGEGGCGVVYMAEQEEPVRRRVALKVIKLGMDTKQVVARFEAERQALAMMDHPNIAKVLDAGATETGRPYFVMELVRGIKITNFSDENKLSTKDRLKLFIHVCQAIQHAHQKGIIHRDIKPSNILVTINDGVPVPKVIDFGIAKATAGRLTDQTLFTAFEQFIGTPAYMSPEQAVLTSLDIDTRSDIYSLGVLLYELLTGGPPFDQEALLAAGLDAMRRTIREQEPPRPSARLSTLTAEALTTTAQCRHTDAPKLIHLLRGDLDWIVMKCLEKDRARRYETANGLAMDIQRHLHNEPVVARPPSKLYEFQKAVRRHKFGFAATAAVIIALAGGAAVATWQARVALRERNRAEAESRKLAQAQTYVQDVLSSFDPANFRYSEQVGIADLLDGASATLEERFADQPLLEAQVRMSLAANYWLIGMSQNSEGWEKLWEAAMQHVRLASKIYQRELGEGDQKTIRSIEQLATYLADSGDLTASEVLRQQVYDVRFRTLGPDANETLAAALNLALVQRSRGHLEEATIVLNEVYATNLRKHGDKNEATLRSLAALAGVLQDLDKMKDAEELCLKYYQTASDVYKQDSGKLQYAKAVLANVYVAQGKFNKAKDLYQIAVSLDDESLRVDEWLNRKQEWTTGTPTFLLFWEPWCPYCQAAMPKANDLVSTYKKDELQVVGLVNEGERSTRQQTDTFIERNKLEFPNAKYNWGQLPQDIRCPFIPFATALHNGKVVWRGDPRTISRSFLDGLSGRISSGIAETSTARKK